MNKLLVLLILSSISLHAMEEKKQPTESSISYQDQVGSYVQAQNTRVCSKVKSALYSAVAMGQSAGACCVEECRSVWHERFIFDNSYLQAVEKWRQKTFLTDKEKDAVEEKNMQENSVESEIEENPDILNLKGLKPTNADMLRKLYKQIKETEARQATTQQHQ